MQRRIQFYTQCNKQGEQDSSVSQMVGAAAAHRPQVHQLPYSITAPCPIAVESLPDCAVHAIQRHNSENHPIQIISDEDCGLEQSAGALHGSAACTLQARDASIDLAGSGLALSVEEDRNQFEWSLTCADKQDARIAMDCDGAFSDTTSSLIASPLHATSMEQDFLQAAPQARVLEHEPVQMAAKMISMVEEAKPEDNAASVMANVSPKTESLGEQQTKPKAKRIRERHISDIVRAVAVWRRLYCGVAIQGEETTLVRYSLTDAAHKVGISRKTLDDYLHLLTMGRKYGFPFTARSNDKVGQLRSFVSKAKAAERVAAKKQKKSFQITTGAL